MKSVLQQTIYKNWILNTNLPPATLSLQNDVTKQEKLTTWNTQASLLQRQCQNSSVHVPINDMVAAFDVMLG